jgi:hypothetical protein
VVEEVELETNVLEFTHKSFAYERSVEVEGTAIALFRRTETESERKFRPKLVHLTVAIPRDWIVADLMADKLVARAGAATPSPAAGGSAVESAAQPSRFAEGGTAWVRHALADGGLLFVPEEWAARLLDPAGLQRIGLA